MTRTIFEELRRVAGELVSQRRAELTLGAIDGDPAVRLEPTEAAASPLEVAIDFASQVTCFPGRSGMTYEVFANDPGEIGAAVGALAAAMVRGDYRERVNDIGERTRVVARWTEGDRIVSPRYNVLRTPAENAPGWRTVDYAPY